MPVLANAGVPMIFVQWPLMVCALVPVVVLEALLVRRWVPLSLREAFIGIGKANVISTLIGVPLAWLGMLALEFAVMVPFGLAAETWKWDLDSPVIEVVGFLFTVAWLVPAEGRLHWMIPLAVGLLLVPCFFLSVLLERRSCVRSWAAVDPEQVRRGVFAANLASYALLFALACGWVTFELGTKGVEINRSAAGQIAPARDAAPLAVGRSSVVAERAH